VVHGAHTFAYFAEPISRRTLQTRMLYTHFRSKEKLRLAVLLHKDGLRNQFMVDVALAGAAPETQLAAV
jgi:AcrR family transcriptional regulator